MYLLASDLVFLQALVNTFLFVLIVAPVQAAVALLLALLINQPLRGVNIFRTIYFMPVVISLVVVSLLWRFIYDGQDGLLNSLLSFLSFGAFQPVDWLGNPATALGAIMAMSVWQGVGFHMVIWLSGLQTIPFVLYEAASISGANGWQKFRYVTWPGLRNTAVLILVVITMQAFGLFTQIDVMTRGGPLDATQSIVFQAVQRGYEKQDIAGGSAISVLLFLLVLAVSLIQRFVTREKERMTTQPAPKQVVTKGVRGRSHRLSVAGRYAALVLVALIFVFPVVFMVVSSFKPDLQLLRDTSSLRAFLPVGELSFNNYADAFERVPIGRFIFNSVLVTGITLGLGSVPQFIGRLFLCRSQVAGQDHHPFDHYRHLYHPF